MQITKQNWPKDAVPLVSICCITYKHENYIRDAIEGFLIQDTTFPVEILINDDASPDKTADIIKEYEEKYPNLIFPIYQKENQKSKGVRPNPTFNYPRARGKYIALCEGDDYWTDPYKLQKQVDEMEKYPEVNISFHIVEKICGKTNDKIGFMGNIGKKTNIYEPQDLFNLRLQNIATCSLIIKSDYIKKPVIEDFMKKHGSSFFLKFLPATPSGALFLNHVMGRYRVLSAGSYGERIKNNKKLALYYYKNVNNAFDKANELTNFKFDKEIQDVKYRRGINVLKRKDLPFFIKCKLYLNHFRKLNKHEKIFLLPLLGEFSLIMNNKYKKLKNKRH